MLAQFAAEKSLTINDGGDATFAAGRGDTAMTLDAIKRYYDSDKYILDPHTAVGVSVAEKFLADDIPTVCLATAHPAKFAAAIQKALGQDLAHHPTLDALVNLPTRRVTLDPQKDVIEKYVSDCLK